MIEDLAWVVCAVAAAGVWGYRGWNGRHPILMALGILFVPPVALAYQVGRYFYEQRTLNDGSRRNIP